MKQFFAVLLGAVLLGTVFLSFSPASSAEIEGDYIGTIDSNSDFSYLDNRDCHVSIKERVNGDIDITMKVRGRYFSEQRLRRRVFW